MGVTRITVQPRPMAVLTMIEQQLPFADEDDSSDWRNIDDRVHELEDKGEVMEAK